MTTPWRAWRPGQVRDVLAGVDVPWCVAAGWAVDLFLGDREREHEDLEIAAPAARFDEVRAALDGYELFAVGDGLAWPLGDERLAATHQTWVLDRDAGEWRLDVFREPSQDGEWVCRRDERIRLPYTELIERTADGVPYARPEAVLLFKAKHARPKDEEDLAAVLPRLEAPRRALLREWLELVHPGHAWLERV